MPDYLRQDLINPRGYVSLPGRPKQSEVAVALTDDGHCVFGDSQTARSTYAKPGSKFMYYDDEVERQRRLVCDTALGQLILDNPKFGQPAVDVVSGAIEKYWSTLKPTLSPAASEKIVTTDGKHVSNPNSFGRLPEAQPSASGGDQFRTRIDEWVKTLKGGDLPRIMNVHDTFLKIYCSQDSTRGKPMDVANRMKYREDWYDDKDQRGRTNRSAFGKTDLPGLITNDFTIPYGESLGRSGIDFTAMRTESRNRGTDMFIIDATKMRPEFRQMLGESNLVFAASASGSTSTLLASAATFVPSLLSKPESAKQYLMGCVAYLVGGGMHTCHEVFYTGRCAGLPYTDGKYLDMLPDTLKSSRVGKAWEAEFWDIVRPDRSSPR